jgi:hypothetical protein
VVVNSASVHGSVGYSTNLFPAMTLGCGAPGGNITSDNIGPQHLMNVKRIAWESRGVEHRTIPADQRMAGAGILIGQALLAVSPFAKGVSAEQGQQEANIDVARSTVPPLEGQATPRAGSGQGVPVLPDRTTIARVVESVLSAQGIPRGGGGPKATPTLKELPSPATVAAGIADRLFGAAAKPKDETGDDSASAYRSASTASAPDSTTSAQYAPASKREPQPAPPAPISPFVSENDVRRAMTRSEKIFVGPKTILTPSARDLGLEHEVFVETEAGSIR